MQGDGRGIHRRHLVVGTGFQRVASEEVESSVRRLGASLSAVGVLAAAVGAGWLLFSSSERAVQLAIGGLVTALIGAMVLLFVPDRLPPEERER